MNDRSTTMPLVLMIGGLIGIVVLVMTMLPSPTSIVENGHGGTYLPIARDRR